MEIVLNLKELTKKSLCPDEYVLLYLMYHKNFDSILNLYGAKYAQESLQKLSLVTNMWRNSCI
jgi:hypothetical protein